MAELDTHPTRIDYLATSSSTCIDTRKTGYPCVCKCYLHDIYGHPLFMETKFKFLF